MKKQITLVLLAVACLLAAPASAQIKFGLKGGLNVTSMSLSSEVFDASNQTGFFIGPTVKFTLPIVGLGVDVSALYDQRQSKLKAAGYDTDATMKTQSVNIPVNLRYGIGLGSMANVFFFAGPQFGFNVGDKDQSLFGQAATWKLKDSNFSVNVGAGVMVMSHVQLSANYNIACGKTGDVTVLEGAGEVVKGLYSKGKASAWQISAAYFF